MKDNPPICSDDYKSISEMDDEFSQEKNPDYFQILSYYTHEARKIIGDICNERKYTLSYIRKFVGQIDKYCRIGSYIEQRQDKIDFHSMKQAYVKKRLEESGE